MDIKLFYREEGSGYPLILLHGNGEDSSRFRHQLDYFSKEYHVIALDTRGHGNSPRGDAPFTFGQFAQDLLEFMNDKGIFRANILGFSDGGITALMFALDHPERVNKLILNGVNLDVSGIIPPVRKRIMEKEQQLAAVKDSSEEAMHRYELFHLMATQPAIDPARLKDLEMPVLIIVGTEDLIDAEHTKLIYRSIPHAELVFVQGDHFVAYDNPSAFNEAVEKFLHEVS
ncbi:MAG: alpha/beta fold hydrolase [Eggerthellaceae bacterium]